MKRNTNNILKQKQKIAMIIMKKIQKEKKIKLYLVKYITYKESKHRRLKNAILNLLKSWIKRNDK